MNRTLKAIGILSLVFTAFSSLSAKAESTSAYYTIAQIRTSLEPNSNIVLPKDIASCANTTSAAVDATLLDDPVTEADKIVNLGLKIWKFIVDGKPVLTLQSNSATALPKGVSCWTDLSNWHEPASATYSVTASNSLGMDVVSFKYRIVYIYGGSYNGVGQYLGYASMQAEDVHLSWGFNLDAQNTIPSVFNVGSKETPIGAMQMVMQYKISSNLSVIEQSQAYYITGSGTIKQLQ